jgi:hypothetical protein
MDRRVNELRRTKRVCTGRELLHCHMHKQPRQGWSCSPSYAMWYEFPPAGWVTCGNAPSPNDIMAADMVWMNGNVEYAFVYDLTSGSSCSASQTGVSEPSWEQFMAEFPKWTTLTGSGFYYLPKFSALELYDAEVNYAPISQLSNPYPAYMTNGPGGEYNIILGSILQSGSIGSYFTETWQTSSGT